MGNRRRGEIDRLLKQIKSDKKSDDPVALDSWIKETKKEAQMMISVLDVIFVL